MSSGTLPLSTYHRASQIGEGTYGSVLTVYNSDGDEFALKLFDEENDDEDDDSGCLDLGALREISCLRLLRGENAHENIIGMHDVASDWSEEEQGAGTAGLGMALPLYPMGSLAGSLATITSKIAKVRIAHGLLSAVAFLHDNGILHRDIKSDNILLEHVVDNNVDYYKPILIDFSLAKLLDGTMYGKSMSDTSTDEPTQHTGEVGTVTYMAPEVVAREPYSYPMDLWSVGVVLLELLLNKPLAAMKNKEASVMIDQTLAQLSDQPFPNLLRGLLCKEPDQRLTARQALQHELFCKFDMSVSPIRLLNPVTALPLSEEADDDTENRSPPTTKKTPKGKKNRVLEQRQQTIHKICHSLKTENPMTERAALEYSICFFQLDDTLDNLAESQSLLDCIVLAVRFFELEVLDLHELDEADTGYFCSWSLEEYVDNEATLFMMMDYCLYPRTM